MVIGRKRIELRRWNTKYRGRFIIHASKHQPSKAELQQFKLDKKDLDFGALIGSAELIMTRNYDALPEEDWKKDAEFHLAGPEYRSSTKGFILKNPIKFDVPIPFKGQLSFFNVPDSVGLDL